MAAAPHSAPVSSWRRSKAPFGLARARVPWHTSAALQQQRREAVDPGGPAPGNQPSRVATTPGSFHRAGRPQERCVIDVQRMDRQIDTWLDEDIGSGDLTTELMIEAGANGRYRMMPRGSIVVAGLPVVERIFKRRDPRIAVTQHLRDGEEAGSGAWLVTVDGPVRPILTVERVALNLVQRLSAIATETARFVAAVKGTNAVVVDSRHTTPGLRVLEKYAVTCGGGHNHRIALDGGILLAGSRAGPLGGIAAAIAKARPVAPLLTKIGVECDTLDQVTAAVEAGADLVMLDMDNDRMREAVRLVDGRATVGCYGDVTLGNIRGKAETGVDVISVNRLTQSPPMVDINLDEAVA